MQIIDEKSYNEMVSTLESFNSRMRGYCSELLTSTRTAVINSGNDETTMISASKVMTATSKIQEALNEISKIKVALQEQLSEAKRAKQIMEED